MASFSESGRFLGTDATENWSAEEFRKYAEPAFAAGNGWNYTPTGGFPSCSPLPAELCSTGPSSTQRDSTANALSLPSASDNPRNTFPAFR